MSSSSSSEEEFYEAIDRILSSSCSSTSSDDDADHRRRNYHLPRFLPPASSSYDVWISEPSSVEERRRRLLQQMGLSGDRALSRSKSTLRSGRQPTREVEIGTSVSSDGLFRRSPRRIPISPSHVGDPNPERKQQPISVPRSFSSPAPNIPSLIGSADNKEFDIDGGADDGGNGDRFCTIKNLDDGREFLVKDLLEDGMWNKVSEMGTGRQLTIEEFEMCVGRSPIVQELLRRQSVEESGDSGGFEGPGGRLRANAGSSVGSRWKKRGSWLRSIKNMASTVITGGYNRDRRNSDEMDTSSDKGARRPSSDIDGSFDGRPHHGPVPIKVRQYGKSHKELTSLYMSQEIHAHNGSIWCIKFSSDGQFLASAGEDRIVNVWQVCETERKEELLMEEEGEDVNCNPFIAVISNGSPEPGMAFACVEVNHWERKRRMKIPSNKTVSLDHVMVPEHIFALTEKPICSFRGHLDDVLDLSWSKSQYLLSSSMDKTVRLWHMSSNSCLKTFSHSDYVTCIQFNPVDDRYFISGSLDEKVRIWSIPDRRVVDWNDLHEMITAVCYTPNGQSALVGSHKGTCHWYDTSDNKLHQKGQIDLQNKKRKSNSRKITGFQFAPGSFTEVLITSADSKIWVVDGVELVHKFKGFRNTSSQISASLSANGRYVICASEDSQVYVWRYDADPRPSGAKGGAAVTQSYEHFHCQDVTAAVSWPTASAGGILGAHSHKQNLMDGVSMADAKGRESTSLPAFRRTDADRVSATLPKEKLLTTAGRSCPQNNGCDVGDGVQVQSRSAWGMVIVTAGRGGGIRTYQNFGFPVRI